MELSTSQRLYLQAIFDYFHEYGKWPIYRYVDRKLSKIRRDLDIEEIAKSLPGGWASAFAFNRDLNADAILSISAISRCENSEEDVTAFIRALIFCVETYFSAEGETVEISSDILAQKLNMSELSVRKVGLLLRDANEHPIYQSFGSKDTEYSHWSCTLSRNIQYFDGVTSIEQYLEKIDQLKRSSQNTIKSQGDNQQRNKDKHSAPVVKSALLFENLVIDLLRYLGYIVEPTSRYRDIGYDFLMYRPVASPDGINREQVWAVELKYRNLTSKLGIDTILHLDAYSSRANPSYKALLITNSSLTNEAQLFVTQSGKLEVWDAKKLHTLLKQFPQLRQTYAEAIPQVDNP